MEFRYRGGLERDDHQTARFCLARHDLEKPTPECMEDLEEQNNLEAVCFAYPADELRRFDPDVAYFYRWPSPPGNYVRAADELPPVEWTHLALQVQADGQAFLFLKGRQVSKLPVRIEDTAYDDWRVLVSGQSVDTRLEVRYVMLWRDRRF